MLQLLQIDTLNKKNFAGGKFCDFANENQYLGLLQFHESLISLDWGLKS